MARGGICVWLSGGGCGYLEQRGNWHLRCAAYGLKNKYNTYIAKILAIELTRTGRFQDS